MLIVFDLDGTLVDSVADLCASVSELARRLGGRALSQEEAATMIGEGAPVLVKRALAAAGVDPETPGALAQFLEIYDRRLLERTTPYPGMREVLPILARRARLAVLTNKPLAPSERLLEALGLSAFFDAVVGGDNPYGRKPDPAALRALMDEAGPALLVGDSPIDWKTAEAAGCTFAWARYGFGAVRFGDAKPDTPYVVERPAELPAIVDRFVAVMSGA